MKQEYDAIIVGTGPGGASCARALARAGKKVLMLERGNDGQRVGNSFAVLNKVDLKNAIPLGHAIMIRGITTGGSSLLYCGTATRPAAFLKEQTGIDLDPYADAFIEELGIAPLPDRLVGEAARRIMTAAHELGIKWEFLPKFIRAEKCQPECGDCMFGCPKGAKWTAREFVYECRRQGMELRNDVRVEAVLTENGRAAGVRGQSAQGRVEVRAEKVVLAAGGLGTPVILKNSGIEEAGEGFFSDPLVFTYGLRPEQRTGSIRDIPMTAGTWQFHASDGFILTDLAEPLLMQWSSMALNFPPRLDLFPFAPKMLGIMTKVKDPISGVILRDGSFTKKLEPEVKERLRKGDTLAREILLKAGCRKSSLFTSPVKAAHPGGSAPIGKVLDHNLEVKGLKNCYVADASVVPDELGTPVVLLALSLGAYAADKILQNWN